MKAADVVIGGEYLTRVSGELVRVRVTAVVNQIVDLFKLSGPRKRTAYAIERVDGGRKLTPRSAARLRPAPAAKSAVVHTKSGNCWLRALECEVCGVGTGCDVCHEHEEPRGSCGGCEECPVCEANGERLDGQLVEAKEPAS